MKIVVVGINHRDTPLEIREKGSFMTRTIREGITQLLGADGIEEVVIRPGKSPGIWGLWQIPHQGLSGGRYLCQKGKNRV